LENPYLDYGLSELAQACDERASELQARSWRSEAERNALREATAELLSAVAHQLSDALASPSVEAPDAAAADELGISALREIIATHVTHTPLSDGMRHPWVQAFVPGDGEAPTRQD
jgi:hypothetical protein